MKKSVVLTTTAASIGLATVLTLSAVAPSMAKSSSHSNNTSAASTKSAATGTGLAFGNTADARKFTSVNFTISNVPSTITDAATAAKLLVVKIAPLAAEATAAPATAPVPTCSGKSGDARPDFTLGASGDARPAFGDNDGDGPKGGRGGHGGHGPKGGAMAGNGQGGWSPTGTTTSTRPAPASGDARPAFGDNDGDGPKGGRGGHGPHGGPRGMHLTNLSLVNGVLTGTIELPGAPVAGVQKFGVYLSIAADSANGIVAQSATPVMVTVTTAADLTPSVTATTGNVTLAITKQ